MHQLYQLYQMYQINKIYKILQKYQIYLFCYTFSVGHTEGNTAVLILHFNVGGEAE